MSPQVPPSLTVRTVTPPTTNGVHVPMQQNQEKETMVKTTTPTRVRRLFLGSRINSNAADGGGSGIGPGRDGIVDNTAIGIGGGGTTNTDSLLGINNLNDLGAVPSSTSSSSTTPTISYYYDPITGRLTNNSRDDNNSDNDGSRPNNGDIEMEDNDELESSSSSSLSPPNTVGYHDLVPSNGRPVVLYQESSPYYPIRYSCEGMLLPGSSSTVGDTDDVDSDTTTPGDTPSENTIDQSVSLNDIRNSMVELPVPISFEFILPTNVDDIDGNVKALQWSVLQSLAERCGLTKRCNLDQQFNSDTSIDTIPPTDGSTPAANTSTEISRTSINENNKDGHGPRFLRVRRELLQNIDSLPYPTSIYAVGSNPSVEWSNECNGDSLRDDQSENQCIKMNAVIDVLYRGMPQEDKIIKDFVRSTLRTRLEFDPNHLFIKNIEGIEMVEAANEDTGTVSVAGTNPPTSTETETDTPPTTGPPLHIIIPVVAAALVALFSICFMWSRCKARQRQSKKVSTKANGLDLEAATSAETDPSTSPSSNEGAVGAKDLRQNPEMENNDSEEKDRPSQSIEVDTSAGLPPRPPRRNSTNLKKKRRRKKKKKIAALKRTNSRENISEMPTISESGSEDDESEYDSDYTGEDEDGSASYDTSSGCITPIGSLSRSSSRASSPRLSPVHDAGRNDTSFVIEAPDFPHLLKDAFAKNAMKSATGNSTSNKDQLPPLPPLVNRVTSEKVVLGELGPMRLQNIDGTATWKRSSRPSIESVPSDEEESSGLPLELSSVDDGTDSDEENDTWFHLPWLKH